jgi:hypothetical protein
MANVPCGLVRRTGERIAVCTNRAGHDGAHFDDVQRISWDTEKVVEIRNAKEANG